MSHTFASSIYSGDDSVKVIYIYHVACMLKNCQQPFHSVHESADCQGIYTQMAGIYDIAPEK